MPKVKLYTLSIFCMLTAFSLDYLSKLWAHAALEPGMRHTFIPGLLNLVLVDNTGLAFSLVNKNELLARFLSSTVFIGLICFYIARHWRPNSIFSWLEEIGLSIIIGAAAGNLLERFLCGRVTDFIEFAFINFPVFNVADALIDTGVGLLLISMYFGKKPNA